MLMVKSQLSMKIDMEIKVQDICLDTVGVHNYVTVVQAGDYPEYRIGNLVHYHVQYARLGTNS